MVLLGVLFDDSDDLFSIIMFPDVRRLIELVILTFSLHKQNIKSKRRRITVDSILCLIMKSGFLEDRHGDSRARG
jgi:hypothetical protein